MTWILLALCAAAIALNFGSAAKKTETPTGIFCVLLPVGAVGAYTARTGIAITGNIILRTAKASGEIISNREVEASQFGTLFRLPSMGVSILQSLLGFPLFIAVVILVLKNMLDAKEQTMEEAAARRIKLSFTATALMLVTFIASAVMIIPRAKDLMAASIAFGTLIFFFLLVTLLCPFAFLVLCMVAGMGIVTFLQLLSLPIMLYFIASAYYLLTAVCALSMCAKAVKLTNVKKRWLVLMFVLSLLPALNNAVYILLPEFMKKPRFCA